MQSAIGTPRYWDESPSGDGEQLPAPAEPRGLAIARAVLRPAN